MVKLMIYFGVLAAAIPTVCNQLRTIHLHNVATDSMIFDSREGRTNYAVTPTSTPK